MQNVPSRTSAGGDRQRGRPRAFDRDAALASAMKTFWRRGYSATSLSDLIRTMGIGSASLYAAFGSKEGLYREALEFYAAQNGPCVWARFEAASTAREAMEAFLLDSAATLAPRSGETPAGCMITLSSVGGEGCPELGRVVAAMRASGLEQIRSRLARAKDDGELAASADIEAITRFYAAVQAGMSIQARDGASRHELELAAHAALAGWETLTHRVQTAKPPSSSAPRPQA